MEAEKRIDFRKEDLKRAFEEYKKEKKNLLKKIEEKFSVLENIFITEETKGSKEFLEMKFKKASKSLNIYHREMVTDINLFTNRLNQIGVKENKKTFLDALEEGIQKRFEKVETMFAKSFLESDIVSKNTEEVRKTIDRGIKANQLNEPFLSIIAEIDARQSTPEERLKESAEELFSKEERKEILQGLENKLNEKPIRIPIPPEWLEEADRLKGKAEKDSVGGKIVELDFSKFCQELEEQANERSSAPIFREYINDKTLKPVNAAYIENSLGQVMFMVITNKGKIKYYSEEKFFKKFVEA